MAQTTFPPTQSNLQYTTIPPTGASQSLWEGILSSSLSATNTIIGTGSGLIAYSTVTGTSVTVNGLTTYLTANQPTTILTTIGSTTATVKAPVSPPNAATFSYGFTGSQMTPQDGSIATNGSGTWVISGYNGGNSGQAQSYYSTNNGATWATTSPGSGAGADGYLMKYGNGYFVGIESCGYLTNTSSTTVVYSTNGSTWTQTSSGLTGIAGINNAKNSLATDGNGTWIATSRYASGFGAGNAAYSRNNGASWSVIGSPFSNTNPSGGQTDCFWNGSRFFIAKDSAYMYSSTDLTTWTGGGAKSVGGSTVYGNGIWLSVSGTSVQASLDNLGSFQNNYSTCPNNGGNWTLCYLNGYFIAVQYGPASLPSFSMYSSNNGLTWTIFTTLMDTSGNGPKNVASSEANNTYISIGSSGTGQYGVQVATLSSTLPTVFGFYQPSTQLH